MFTIDYTGPSTEYASSINIFISLRMVYFTSSFGPLSQLLTKVGLYFHQSFGLHKIIMSKYEKQPLVKR